MQSEEGGHKMTEKQRSMLPGVALILVGGYLLLRKLGFVYLRWSEIFPILLLAAGGFFLVSGVRNRESGSAFPATALIILGAFFLFRNFDIFSFDYHFYDAGDFWPVFLIAFGAAFIVQFLLRKDDWGPLVPGVALLFLGSIFLMRNMGFYWFDFMTIWPLALIAIGVLLIVNGVKKRRP